MRALAVGMVVIYHLYPSLLRGGFAGVDVFFVISGFLITGHLLREYQKTGRIGLLDFWGRRAKRLVPAAALVLTVTWLASRLLLPATQAGGHRGPDQGERAVLPELAARVERGRLPQGGQRGQPGAALLVAVRRGAVLPGLAAAVPARGARGAHGAATGRRRARGHHVALLLAGAVVAGSLWYSVYYTHANPAGAYFVTTTRIWELGLGGLLALLPAALSKRIGRFGVLGWAGLGLVVASAFVLQRHRRLPRVPRPAARRRRRGC